MKKLNKKGFSLVELIVVVAIMAVLVGVLAPSLLRYVEKTRVQKDISAIAEVEQAVKIACADEAVYKAVSTSATTIAINDASSTNNGGYTLQTADTASALEKEVAKTIAKIDLTSSALNGQTVNVTASVTNGTVSVAVSITGLTGDALTAWTAAGFTNTPAAG